MRMPNLLPIRRLKVLWVGWTGPEMAEVAGGILPFDQDPHFYVMGSGSSRDESAFFVGNGRKITYFTTAEKFFLDIKDCDYDVIIYNTYAYAVWHRPELYPLGGKVDLLVFHDGWAKIKQFKILLEAESFTQFDFLSKLSGHFDAVITFNPVMKDHCDKVGRPCVWTYPPVPANLDDPGLERDIHVSFSGSNLATGYRGEILDVVARLPTQYRVIAESGAYNNLPVDRWVQLLRRSIIHQCTHSPPTGQRHPFHLKNREGKAALCGALPVIEAWAEADGFLAPGTEKVVFHSFQELHDILIYYLENDKARQEIIEAARIRIRAEHTNERLFQRAFLDFKLI